jgi:pantothenate kinase
MDGYHYYRSELDAMDDPAELHRRRGAHWTFNADRFIREMKEARAAGAGAFPSFDHHEGS